MPLQQYRACVVDSLGLGITCVLYHSSMCTRHPNLVSSAFYAIPIFHIIICSFTCYVMDELMLNDEIPSRVAMLVRDLISYRNRVHVTEYNGSCKKQTQKEVFLMYTSTIKALI